MKIDGLLSNGNYLVSMTGDEIASVAGYGPSYTSIPGELHERGDRNNPIRLGIELKVCQAFQQNRALFGQEKKVRDAAGMLRSLADMIEAVGPTEIISGAIEEGAN